MTENGGIVTRDWLRTLPVFPAELPEFDHEIAPATPVELFLSWLEQAVAAEVPAAHAMVLSTSDADGTPAARVLILKDADADGWQFATDSASPKGLAIAHHPLAALNFFWPGLGRQVRIVGSVLRLPQTAADRDFLARPEGSRASTLVGRQSESLPRREQYGEAFAAALDRVRDDPQLVAPGWAVYSVRATAVEFWQASHDRGHLRLRYRWQAGRWTRELLWP